MRRNLLNSFFGFPEPFLFNRIFTHSVPVRIIRLSDAQNHIKDPDDPHQVFSKFFDQHGIKTQAEKQFFKKHYPQKAQPEKIDPYKILELQSNATKQQIYDAYRKLSLKYHPKNNQSQGAPQKFKQISLAHQQLISEKKSNDLGELSSSSFFQDFDKQINDFFKPSQKKGDHSNKQAQKVHNELYQQRSYVEKGNGKKAKVIVQKSYEKNGKKLKVTRQENIKHDGTKQIIQTIDDGKQVKKKIFNDEKQQKKAIV